MMNRNHKTNLSNLLMLAVWMLPFFAQAEETEAVEAETPAISLTFYMDDFQASFDPDVEWTRETLLYSAAQDAIRRTKGFTFKDLIYNRPLPEQVKDVLEVRIMQWNRSHAGFYEFRANATYYDADGKEHSLGILSGVQSSIAVTTRFDVRDAFAKVVEDSLRDAFRKIEKLHSPKAQ